MLYAIRVFQIVDLIGIFYNVFLKGTRDKSWKYLTLAKWVFYFCSIATFVLSFGLYGIVENKDSNDGLFYVFFISICIGVIICVVQQVWCIKYDNKTLIFRNSFGMTKKYDIYEIELVEPNDMSEVRFRGKKVIEWPSVLINLGEYIEFSRFMEKIKSNK